MSTRIPRGALGVFAAAAMLAASPSQQTRGHGHRRRAPARKYAAGIEAKGKAPGVERPRKFNPRAFDRRGRPYEPSGHAAVGKPEPIGKHNRAKRELMAAARAYGWCGTSFSKAKRFERALERRRA
jgi:hypothetical protein